MASRVDLAYDASHQTAVLTMSSDCEVRQRSNVRRLFEERSSSVVVRGSQITIPWWEFISHRDALKYVLRISGLDLNVSAEASHLLREAMRREQAYIQSRSSSPSVGIDEDLQPRLSYVGFDRRLLPYQDRNVRELIRQSSGASFSVPGSGKTSEALAFYCLMRQGNEKLLVIAPNNAFIAWEDELAYCMPALDLHLTRLTGGYTEVSSLLLGDPSVSIISYYQLPYVMDSMNAFLARNRVCMIVDESHRMKRGHEGVHGASILRLSHLPVSKLVLSGTPMPNSAKDLVPQFQFLYPELRTDETTVISDFQGVFVRTTKDELNLPPPIRIQVDVEMSDAQQNMYEALRSDVARHLAGLGARDRLRFRNVAQCVQYMLQAASNPALLANSSIGDHELLRSVLLEGISPKLRESCRIARELVLGGHKVLIWSTFVRTVEDLAHLLSDLGAEFIHGGVGTDEDDANLQSRESIIRRFNDPESSSRVLVANPAACSEGISLHHVCHHAVYVDRGYNAAQYLQSEDRIHRIGLEADTSTSILILRSPDTIDDAVARSLNRKVQNMGLALNDPNLNVSPISFDELSDGFDDEDLKDLMDLLGA